MITSLRLVNFKNFADETLRVGPFTVIIGVNASGKSNIRDAFRFLHGIGRGYSLAEIMGGKYGRGGQVEWEPIRGAPNEVVRFGQADSNSWSAFTIEAEIELGEEKICYSITVGHNPEAPDGFRVLEEELKTESAMVYTTVKGAVGSGLQVLLGDSRETSIELSRAQPALTQSLWETAIGLERFYKPEMDFRYISPVTHQFMESMRFLELSPERMREPSIPGADKLGNSGQNLPTVLEAICAEPDRKRNFTSWLGELTPMDVKDFEFPRDPSGRVHLQIVERNGRKVSAYSASDGTLRFLAMLTVLLGENRAWVYFFEEIDNGIHPARLSLLLDLIERQTAKGGTQVITTTHSPALLTWMNDKTFEHTSIVYRDDYWADSVIRPIAGLYNLRELRKSNTLGELYTEDWIGEAMKFSEGEPDTDHLDDDEYGDLETGE